MPSEFLWVNPVVDSEPTSRRRGNLIIIKGLLQNLDQGDLMADFSYTPKGPST